MITIVPSLVEATALQRQILEQALVELQLSRPADADVTSGDALMRAKLLCRVVPVRGDTVPGYTVNSTIGRFGSTQRFPLMKTGTINWPRFTKLVWGRVQAAAESRKRMAERERIEALNREPAEAMHDLVPKWAHAAPSDEKVGCVDLSFRISNQPLTLAQAREATTLLRALDALFDDETGCQAPVAGECQG